MLYIFRGDDIAFAEYDRRVCIRLDTFKDLTGWSAKFKLIDNEKVFSDISSRLISFGYTAEETSAFPLGKTYAKLTIFDARGQIRQMVQVDVEVLNKVPEPGIGGTISVSVDNVIADYNNIGNKPSINGVTIEGHHDSAHYSLADASACVANAEMIAIHASQIAGLKQNVQTMNATVADQGVAIAQNNQSIQVLKISVDKAGEEMEDLKRDVKDASHKGVREESARKEADASLSSRIDAEVNERSSADRSIRADLENEKNTRGIETAQLTQKLASEITSRTAEGQNLSDAIEAEAQQRKSGDRLNADKLEAAEDRLGKKIDIVSGNLADARDDFSTDLNREAEARKNADELLDAKIADCKEKAVAAVAAEAAARKEIDDSDRQRTNDGFAELSGRIAAEVKARQFTDDALTAEGVKRERKDSELEAALNAESKTRASAVEGVLKEAKEYADGISERALHYCGQVEKASDLTTISSPKVGDMYNVKEDGANYAWNGMEWDKLSETIDLTPFLKKDEFSKSLEQLNAADAENAAAIENEKKERESEQFEIRATIYTTENSLRSFDAELSRQIESVKGTLETEVSARTSALGVETAAREAADKGLDARISTEASERAAAITKEIEDRGTADNLIYSKIEIERQASTNRDTTLTENLAKEVSLRSSEDARILGEAKEYADTVGAKAMHFKGTVLDRAALESIADMKQGDMYNVEEYRFDDGNVAKGSNFAWTGVRWDKLSENIDLTPYARTADVASANSELEEKIAANATAIEEIRGTAGSAADTAVEAKKAASNNAVSIEAEISRARIADNENAQAIADESLRAKGIEGGLREDVTALQTAVLKEQGDRNSEDSRILAEANAHCDTNSKEIATRVTELASATSAQASALSQTNRNVESLKADYKADFAVFRKDCRDSIDAICDGTAAVSAICFMVDNNLDKSYLLKVVMVDDGKGGKEPQLQLSECGSQT